MPSGYKPGVPAPLLIMLHGYSIDGTVEEVYLQLAPFADKNGFLYAHPNGTIDKNGDYFWNATDACCNYFGSTVDDSAYLLSVIDQIEQHYDVDPKRVFFMGHSNGGFMSYRMACDHADKIAGIASLAGAMFDDPTQCHASGPVNVLEIHGTADTEVIYDGYPGDSTPGNGPYPGAATTVKDWATLDGCSLTPDTSSPPLDLDTELPRRRDDGDDVREGLQAGRERDVVDHPGRRPPPQHRRHVPQGPLRLAPRAPQAVTIVPSSLVLRADRIFDGERFLEGPLDVHVEGGVVTRLSPPTEGAPPGAAVIDARGSLVMPGIVNAHVHISRGGTFDPAERISAESVVRNLRGTLAAGVTTVGDMGSTAGMMRALRAHTARAPEAGPSLFAAGPIVTAPGGYPLDWLPAMFVRFGVALPCEDARAGARAVERVAAAGMDCVKIAIMHRSYAERPLPALDVATARAVVAEAHRLGLRVLAHAHAYDDYDVALAAGVDALMHSSFDPLDAEMVARVRDAGIPVVPTLWVFESVCMGAEMRWDQDARLRRHVAPYVRASWSRFAEAYAASGDVLPEGIAGGLPKSRIPESIRTAAANLALLADAGVPIAFGNDASYGFSLVGRPADELAAMQRAGLDPAACLRAATSRAAALLGLTDRGLLAPGKRADILVVDRAAETDLAAVERVRTVIARGERVDLEGAWAAAGVARTVGAFARGLAATVSDAVRGR